MKLNYAIALRLKNLMEDKSIKQYQLFKASGVPQSTISTILSKENKTIKLDTLYSLCQGFQIEIQEFFRDELFNSFNIED